MKLKSFVVGLALVGSSSVALARPSSHSTSYGRAAQGYPARVYSAEAGPFGASDRFDRDRRVRRLERDRFDRDIRFERDGGRRFEDRRRFDDGRRDRDLGTYLRRQTWLALTPEIELERGLQIAELSTRERFAQLRLQHKSGRSLIRQITIELANGARHVVDVNRELVGHREMVNIDLPGDARAIERIIIDGRSAPGATYQLYAM
jgi:hypothetical protein